MLLLAAGWLTGCSAPAMLASTVCPAGAIATRPVHWVILPGYTRLSGLSRRIDFIPLYGLLHLRCKEVSLMAGLWFTDLQSRPCRRRIAGGGGSATRRGIHYRAYVPLLPMTARKGAS